MYYQVSYIDLRTGKRRRSSMIHTSNKAAVDEMKSKTKAGHRKVVVLSGSKLSK